MIQFFNKKMSKKRKGFTLIELVVVIAILGLLVALAVPRLGAVRADAEKKTAMANARTLASAVTMYQAEHGSNSVATDDLGSKFSEYISQGADVNGYKVTLNAGDALESIYVPDFGTWALGAEEFN